MCYIVRQAMAGQSLQYPVPVVCPVCRHGLDFGEEQIACSSCRAVFGYEDSFPNLVLGQRFLDDVPDSELASEERSCSRTTTQYWAPLFRTIWPDQTAPPRILSVGCGVGTDVDELAAAGFDASGIDCGNRTRLWKGRRYPGRLLLANGLHLPFEDQTFDAVFCGCVFPHVGVIGDTFQVAADFNAQRLQLATEIGRVLKPGGRLFAANPNRLCPLDLFHRPKGSSLMPRWNSPSDPFLLSVGDFRKLLAEAGFGSVHSLPPRSYWHFHRTQESWKGRLLAHPLHALFWTNSLTTSHLLRSSAVAPWLVVQGTMPSS